MAEQANDIHLGDKGSKRRGFGVKSAALKEQANDGLSQEKEKKS